MKKVYCLLMFIFLAAGCGSSGDQTSNSDPALYQPATETATNTNVAPSSGSNENAPILNSNQPSNNRHETLNASPRVHSTTNSNVNITTQNGQVITSSQTGVSYDVSNETTRPANSNIKSKVK